MPALIKLRAFLSKSLSQNHCFNDEPSMAKRSRWLTRSNRRYRKLPRNDTPGSVTCVNAISRQLRSCQARKDRAADQKTATITA